MVIVPESPASIGHPLDPLSAAEIAEAAAVLRAQRGLGPRTRLVTVSLKEPTRHALRQHRHGTPLERLAEIVLLDNATGQTSEAIVSLTRQRVADWRAAAGNAEIAEERVIELDLDHLTQNTSSVLSAIVRPDQPGGRPHSRPLHWLRPAYQRHHRRRGIGSEGRGGCLTAGGNEREDRRWERDDLPISRALWRE